MANPVTIAILARGVQGSGKSLAIDNMVRGLRDNDYFHVGPVNYYALRDGSEAAFLEVKLKVVVGQVIEHDDT